MNPEQNQVTESKEEPVVFLDELDNVDIDVIIPKPEATVPIITKEECIVEDQKLLGLYDEILSNCRSDRTEIDSTLANFLDMVVNDGDASSATKEAVVNLMKTKTDISDKMTKIADLMTRIKLKDKDTFPRYLATHQQNNIHLDANNSHRELIKTVQKSKGAKK
jgi:hypothetical protein